MPQQRRRIGGTTFVVSLAVTMARCGGGPAAPTTLPPNAAMAVTVSAAMLIATPASPAHAAVLDYRSMPVVLTATVPAPPAGALIIDTFELDDNPEFSSPTAHAVARQSGSSSATFNIGSSQIDKDFYWRVRPAADERQGANSDVFRFRVSLEALRAPLLERPLSGSMQPPRPNLVATKLIHSSNALERSWSYEFEVARDQSFTTIVGSEREAEHPGVMNFVPAADLPAGRYYWHVRAIDETGRASAFSETWSFDVMAPFADVPIAIAPAPGATVSQRATFVLRTPRVFDDSTGTRVKVELSTTPTFSAIVAGGLEWAYDGGEAVVTVSQTMPGGTYYWRAKTVLLAVPTRGEISSGWTEPRVVSLIGQVLGTPVLLSPGRDATTTMRPTMTVQNVSRSQPGSLVYRFEVSTDSQFNSAPFAVGTAFEGSATTGWTPPFDFPVGIALWWRAQALDSSTGTASAYSNHTRFAAVDSRTNLYTLTIGVPVSCSFISEPPSFYVQSPDAFGASRLRLTALDAVYYTADTMVLDLGTDAAGRVAGTLEGAASSFVVQGPGGVNSATVAGAATANGISGTFSGRLVKGTPVGGGTCNSTSFTWSLVPRKQ